MSDPVATLRAELARAQSQMHSLATALNEMVIGVDLALSLVEQRLGPDDPDVQGLRDARARVLAVRLHTHKVHASAAR